MDKQETQLKSKVMSRVYYIWFLRGLFSAFTAKMVAMAALLWQMSYNVSFAHVLSNLPDRFDVLGDAKYFVYAFNHTELSVQVYVFFLSMFTIWLLVEKFPKAFPNLGRN